jgi:hypothetical protein
MSSLLPRDITDTKFIGILFVLIVSIICIAKITFFSIVFKSKEDVENSYQKIAIYSLVVLAIIHFFIQVIF